MVQIHANQMIKNLLSFNLPLHTNPVNFSNEIRQNYARQMKCSSKKGLLAILMSIKDKQKKRLVKLSANPHSAEHSE